MEDVQATKNGAIKQSFITFQDSFLVGEMQESIKETRGNDLILHFSSYNVKGSSSCLHCAAELRDLMVINGNNEAKVEKISNAHEVFDELSTRKILKNDGLVQNYFDEFNSLLDNKGLNESYVIDLFVWGLHPEIKKWVKLLKPKTLSDAFCLAKLQETTNNLMKKKKIVPPFLHISNCKYSREVKRNDNCLIILDKLCKESFKGKEDELRDSNEATKNDICLVDLENCDKEVNKSVKTETLGSIVVDLEKPVTNEGILVHVSQHTHTQVCKSKYDLFNKVKGKCHDVLRTIEEEEDSEEYGNPIVLKLVVADTIKSRTDALLKKTKTVVSSKPIVMIAEYTHCPNLTIIDTPGFVSKAKKGEPDSTPEEVLSSELNSMDSIIHVDPDPEKWGKTIEEERSESGIGSWPSHTDDIKPPNDTLILYGGAAFERVMHKFRCATYSIEWPPVSRDKVANIILAHAGQCGGRGVLNRFEDYLLYRKYLYDCVDGNNVDGNNGMEYHDASVHVFKMGNIVVLFFTDQNIQVDMQLQDQNHMNGKKTRVQAFCYYTKYTIKDKIVTRAYNMFDRVTLVICHRCSDEQKTINKDDSRWLVRFGAEMVLSSSKESIDGNEDNDRNISKGVGIIRALGIKVKKLSEAAMKFNIEYTVAKVQEILTTKQHAIQGVKFCIFHIMRPPEIGLLLRLLKDTVVTYGSLLVQSFTTTKPSCLCC